MNGDKRNMIWKDWRNNRPKKDGYYILYMGQMQVIKYHVSKNNTFNFYGKFEVDKTETLPDTYFWRELTKKELVRVIANEV